MAADDGPQVFYQAMDFLLSADEQVRGRCSLRRPTCSTSKSTCCVFDTTSTYFETDHDDELRRYGHCKDHRPDRPQAVIGTAVTREGIPVRVWTDLRCSY